MIYQSIGCLRSHSDTDSPWRSDDHHDASCKRRRSALKAGPRPFLVVQLRSPPPTPIYTFVLLVPAGLIALPLFFFALTPPFRSA